MPRNGDRRAFADFLHARWNRFGVPNVSLKVSWSFLETVLAKLLDVSCTGSAVESASIGHNRSGATFRCTLSRVPQETLDALDDAARSGGKVRLAFPDRPLILGDIEVARIGPGRIRIAGRVMESD